MRPTLLTVLAWVLATIPAAAQPALFGSLDDPSEVHRRARWDRSRDLDLMGGFSLIGAQWRTAAATRLLVEGAQGSFLVDASVRAGIYGGYEPDYNQAYDLLRVVRHVRLDPVGRRFLYARLGPIRRGRLGLGHLVSFFSGETAWDDRRVGLEIRGGSEALALYALADDVQMDHVVGFHGTWNPLPGAGSTLARSVQFGGSYVVDRSTSALSDTPMLAAWEAEFRFIAVQSGAFALWPFASYARFTHFGEGLLFGADLEADNFIDLARLFARLAVHYGGDRFEPGYFGAFYPVHNPRARIVDEVEPETPGSALVGVPLSEIRSATSVLTEFRVHLFERFEFWYAFTRNYGSQSLSTMHVRLYLRARRFRLGLGQDRAGLDGFFSLFGSLHDQAALFFRTDYRMFGTVWVHADARYTYERIDTGDDDARRYLVQRRFEPFVGIRFAL